MRVIGKRAAQTAAAIMLTAGLAACGGGGGGVASTPIPNVGPIAGPPASTTPSAASFQTAEYLRSSGAPYHQAIPAWQAGATGSGVTIGYVDSGIDGANPEFAGRISPASRDVVASRALSGEPTHGTQVVLTAAAARNNTGVVGIAYDSTILMARADTAGSCLSSGGCSFSDNAIAAGVDLAVTNGARVVNLSLGGSSPSRTLVDAIGRAAAAGVVVVVSAGNDGASTDPTVDPANPDPFASGLRMAGNGNVIIAGSVNDQGQFSSFSNRAGSEAGWFLSALGEEVCCVYENGQIKVTTNGSGQQFVTVVSGTSYSAPQVSAAAALLAQAFPTLTAAQIVNLLLTSATDAGATGTDGTYGRGILNIANAFAPKGTTSLAGTTSLLALGATGLTGSSATGDSALAASASTVVLDSYARAYATRLAARPAGYLPRLSGALLAPARSTSGAAGPLSLAFAVGPARSGQLRLAGSDAAAARLLAGQAVTRLGGKTALAFAYGQGADGIAARLAGQDRPAFTIARAAPDDFGFVRSRLAAVVVRHQLGRLGLTAEAESGGVPSAIAPSADLPRAALREDRFTRFGLALDRRFGPLGATLGLGLLDEDRTVLGARLADALAPRGSRSLLVDAGAQVQVARRWQLSADLRRVSTHARTSAVVAPGSNLAATGWSIDLARSGLFQRGDQLALRLSQPLRVGHGGLGLLLPSGWNYAAQSPEYALSRITLAPRGRERDAELGWHGALWGGAATASLFWRAEPGNMANAPADAGMALSWRRGF